MSDENNLELVSDENNLLTGSKLEATDLFSFSISLKYFYELRWVKSAHLLQKGVYELQCKYSGILRHPEELTGTSTLQTGSTLEASR